MLLSVIMPQVEAANYYDRMYIPISCTCFIIDIYGKEKNELEELVLSLCVGSEYYKEYHSKDTSHK